MTLAPCPTHGSTYRVLHEPNFRGIVEVIQNLLETVSGVGTRSYSRCAVGYPFNFEGVVRALEDLNTTISGIQGGGTVQAGSGIYLTASGDVTVVNTSASTVQAGSGIFFTASGTTTVINATISSISGALYSAGSGLYLVNGTQFNVNYDDIFKNGSVVTVSGAPGANYNKGSLWFDTNEGRLFVYASGNGVSNPAWYQTNTDAVVLKGDTPPSGTGTNAPARDGSLWFNSLMGNLFVYDANSSGWYEAAPSRSFAYGESAPATTSVQGAGWFNTTSQQLQVWNGTSWVPA